MPSKMPSGFEDFLNHVESDRFNRTIKTPQMFEKLLRHRRGEKLEQSLSGVVVGWYRGGTAPIFYPDYISPIT